MSEAHQIDGISTEAAALLDLYGDLRYGTEYGDSWEDEDLGPEQHAAAASDLATLAPGVSFTCKADGQRWTASGGGLFVSAAGEVQDAEHLIWGQPDVLISHPRSYPRTPQLLAHRHPACFERVAEWWATRGTAPR